MLEYAKDIVIAMIEHGYITRTASNETNIQNVNKALDEIIKQFTESNN